MRLLKRFGFAMVWVLAIAVAAAAQTGAATDAIAAALRDRNFAGAVERSRLALRTAPNDPRLWTLNGLALAGLGKRADAIASFQRALKIDPKYLAALEGASQ